MNQKKLSWDTEIRDGMLILLDNIGLSKSQSLRIIDEIDKSMDWNNELEIFSDSDRILLDGPADSETCIKCLLHMKSGPKTVKELKNDEAWEVSPHANCRCNYSYETRLTMNKKQHVHHLIQKFSEQYL